MHNTPQDILIRRPMAVMTGLRGDAARAGAVDIRIAGGRIAEMGADLMPRPGERVIDASDCIVYPGWINTHHHLFQNLLKAVPEGMNQDLQGWLASVPYPRLPLFTPELMRTAARLGMAELLLSGATTCADHHYLYHAGGGTESGDMLFDVADEFGMRFVLCRGGAIGSASSHPGFSKTALQPETLDQMLADIERLKHRYHDDAPDAMRRVVVAPTTPTFSLPPALLVELARAARGMHLRMHTHLSETDNYVRFCREKYNCLPVEFVAEHEWLGPDVWFAHLVHLQPSEIRMLAQTGSGIAHCPVSNSRLGSGIAPTARMRELGMNVAIGTDGSASNNRLDLIEEARTAALLAKGASGDACAWDAHSLLESMTLGGARALGLADRIGSIVQGKCADLVAVDLSADALRPVFDPVSQLAYVAGREHVSDVWIAGRHVVSKRQLTDPTLRGLVPEVSARSTLWQNRIGQILSAGP